MMFSTLELSLLILAGGAIVAVLAYNAWQGRAPSSPPGARPASRAGPTGAQATAPAGERSEPSLGSPKAEDLDSPDIGLEPTLVGAPPAAAVLDSRVDCIGILHLHHPLSGDRLIGAGQSFRRVGSKPVLSDAQIAPGVQGKTSALGTAVAWEPPRADRHYQTLRLGVLLSNRNGPLNSVEFAEFTAGVQSLGDLLDASVELPEMMDSLGRARELDAFCAAQDAQLMIHVDAPGPLSIDDLAQAATTHGLTERGNNRWLRQSNEGGVQFSIGLGDQPNRLSLLLDLPRTAPDGNPWEALVACAQDLTKRFNGVLVDDSGRRLGDDQLEAIRSQLMQRAETLQAAGIAPGSALAQRLFN